MKLDKDALVKLIKEVHLQEFSRVDLEDLGGKPNNFHVYGFFDNGTGVLYSSESNIKLALDSACKYRNEEIRDEKKGLDVSAYRIIIQCPKDDDDFPLGKTSFTVFGGKKKNNAWRHFEIVKGSCGKDKWVANTIPPGYYSACGEPAITESKDYKRLTSKWLTEKRKISAEKNSRFLLSEAPDDKETSYLARRRAEEAKRQPIYDDGEWRVWKVDTIQGLYQRFGSPHRRWHKIWFPRLRNAMFHGLQGGKGKFSTRDLYRIGDDFPGRPARYIKLIGDIPIDCHVFYPEKLKKFFFTIKKANGDTLVVDNKFRYADKTDKEHGNYILNLYKSYLKRIKQINKAIEVHRNTAPPKPRSAYRYGQRTGSELRLFVERNLLMILEQLQDIQVLTRPYPGSTVAPPAVASLAKYGPRLSNMMGRMTGEIGARPPLPVLGDRDFEKYKIEETPDIMEFLRVITHKNNFQKFKKFMAIENPLYRGTRGKKGKSWNPEKMVPGSARLKLSPSTAGNNVEILTNMLLNHWKHLDPGGRERKKIFDLLKRVQDGATGIAPRGSVSIAQQPTEKGALTVVDVERGQLSVTDKAVEEVTEQVGKMLAKRLIERFFARPKKPSLPPPDKKKMQQRRAAVRIKANRSSREIVNWMRNARNAARIAAIIKSVGGAAAAGKATIVIGGFALTGKFVYETFKALTDPARDFKSAKFDSRDYPVPTKKAESDYQDVGPCPEDGC